MNSLDIMNHANKFNIFKQIFSKRKFTKTGIKNRKSKYPLSIKEVKYQSNS